MRVNNGNTGKKGIATFLIRVAILCTVCYCTEIVVENKEVTMVISKDEELNQKLIGPLNKYELLNSFPSYFSTDKKKKQHDLIRIYDSNLFVVVKSLDY